MSTPLEQMIPFDPNRALQYNLARANSLQDFGQYDQGNGTPAPTTPIAPQPQPPGLTPPTPETLGLQQGVPGFQPGELTAWQQALASARGVPVEQVDPNDAMWAQRYAKIAREVMEEYGILTGKKPQDEMLWQDTVMGLLQVKDEEGEDVQFPFASNFEAAMEFVRRCVEARGGTVNEGAY